MTYRFNPLTNVGALWPWCASTDTDELDYGIDQPDVVVQTPFHIKTAIEPQTRARSAPRTVGLP